MSVLCLSHSARKRRSVESILGVLAKSRGGAVVVVGYFSDFVSRCHHSIRARRKAFDEIAMKKSKKSTLNSILMSFSKTVFLATILRGLACIFPVVINSIDDYSHSENCSLTIQVRSTNILAQDCWSELASVNVGNEINTTIVLSGLFNKLQYQAMITCSQHNARHSTRKYRFGSNTPGVLARLGIAVERLGVHIHWHEIASTFRGKYLQTKPEGKSTGTRAADHEDLCSWVKYCCFS